jgi:transposase
VRGRRSAGRKRGARGRVKHSIVAAWHMLATGELYLDPGADYFERRIDPQRKIKRLIA